MICAEHIVFLIRLEENARKQREREAELEDKKRKERQAFIAAGTRTSPAPSPEKPEGTASAGGGGGGYVPPTRRIGGRLKSRSLLCICVIEPDSALLEKFSRFPHLFSTFT